MVCGFRAGKTNIEISNFNNIPRWLCSEPTDVPIVMATKFPATVMVLGVVSNKGDVMPPHVFEAGLRVNAEVYLDVMINIVKPWMDQVANGRPYIWQQDSVPAHTAKKGARLVRGKSSYLLVQGYLAP